MECPFTCYVEIRKCCFFCEHKYGIENGKILCDVRKPRKSYGCVVTEWKKCLVVYYEVIPYYFGGKSWSMIKKKLLLKF